MYRVELALIVLLGWIVDWRLDRQLRMEASIFVFTVRPLLLMVRRVHAPVARVCILVIIHLVVVSRIVLFRRVLVRIWRVVGVIWTLNPLVGVMDEIIHAGV